VLVFLFPLIIVAFCYNLISEEEESGRWKLLSVQSSNLTKLLDSKLIIRFFAVSAVYLILLLIAVLWIQIPFDLNLLLFALAGWLYLIFWFMLCRWIISFRKTSAQNALLLLTVWVGINFIIPMSSNIIIQKIFPVQESLKAVMEQREGYHNKWDEPKLPTMATIVLPNVDEIISPMIFSLPIQLLAYHTAVFMGTDVDQPRNLAKSVTVE